ncbi:MAG: helix-turn-helix transcriptional regulator [Deltaproteobacteria bacterium]|nr:helix-turn-helix transcriptional regulator [Deltaproteobacteria bacterium]
MKASGPRAVEFSSYDSGAMAGRPPSREAPFFGQRVATLRKKAGLTQAALARQLGVSAPLVAYYERQTPNPTVEVVGKLAAFFDVPPAYFLDDTVVVLSRKRGKASELEQRVAKLKHLPKGKQKLLLRMLDAFIADSAAE